MSGTPMRYPVSNFTSDFFGIGATRNDRIALIVVFKWVSLTGSWNIRKSPLFFAFCGKDGEDRTRDFTAVHNPTSCLRRHCDQVD